MSLFLIILSSGPWYDKGLENGPNALLNMV